MKRESFQSSSSGRLVSTATNGIEHWAFVPSPLPPELILTREMWAAVSDADRALGELAGLGRNTERPQLLIQPYIRKEAVLSSRIEGTRADLKDVFAFEAGKTDGSSESDQVDVREVHNYVVATEYGAEQIKHRAVTLSLLRELHERLLFDVRGERDRPGEFRDVQNWVGTSNDVTLARFVPPPVIQMRDALNALEEFMNSQGNDLPPVVRLALIHYQFEAIHPFRDGNGRIGRLLLVLLLLRWNILPAPLLYLSAYLERERQVYYDLLLGVSQRGAWEEWIVFIARGIAEQAKDASERAKQLEDLRRLWHKKLRALRVPKVTYEVCDWLFERPFLSIPNVASQFGVAYNTASATVRRLLNAGILSRVAGTSVKYYVAQEVGAALRRSKGRPS